MSRQHHRVTSLLYKAAKVANKNGVDIRELGSTDFTFGSLYRHFNSGYEADVADWNIIPNPITYASPIPIARYVYKNYINTLKAYIAYNLPVMIILLDYMTSDMKKELKPFYDAAYTRTRLTEVEIIRFHAQFGNMDSLEACVDAYIKMHGLDDYLPFISASINMHKVLLARGVVIPMLHMYRNAFEKDNVELLEYTIQYYNTTADRFPGYVLTYYKDVPIRCYIYFKNMLQDRIRFFDKGEIDKMLLMYPLRLYQEMSMHYNMSGFELHLLSKTIQMDDIKLFDELFDSCIPRDATSDITPGSTDYNSRTCAFVMKNAIKYNNLLFVQHIINDERYVVSTLPDSIKYAVEARDVLILKYLDYMYTTKYINECVVNYHDLLQSALTRSDNNNVLRYLLDKSTLSVTELDNLLNTAMLSCQHDRVLLLLDKGADISNQAIRYNKNISPFREMIHGGKTSMIESILRVMSDKEYDMLLSVALYSNDIDILMWLLRHRAINTYDYAELATQLAIRRSYIDKTDHINIQTASI